MDRSLSIRSIATDDRLLEVVASSSSSSSSPPLVAFTVKSEIDVATRTSSTSLWVHDVSTLQSRRMVSTGKGTASLSNPWFATEIPGAEDSVLFTRSSDGQVYALPLNGGESSRVTSFALPIESFKVFLGRDNQPWLLSCMNVYPSLSPAETAARDKEQAATNQSSGMIFDSLMVRHWDTWNCYAKSHHLFLSPLSVDPNGLLVLSEDARDKHTIDLMWGRSSDCPGKGPGGGSDAYAVSPDGRWLALCFRGAEEGAGSPKDMAWSTDCSLYVCQVPLASPAASPSPSPSPSTSPSSSSSSSSSPASSRGGPPLLKVNTLPTYHGCPVFSPDSRLLAFVAHARPGYESDACVLHIATIEAEEPHHQAGTGTGTVAGAGAGAGGSGVRVGSVRAVSANIDLSFSGLQWTALPLQPSDPPSTFIFASAQLIACSRAFLLGVNDDGSALTSIAYVAGDVSRSNLLPLRARVGGVDTSLLYFLESSFSAPTELKRALLDTPRSHPHLLVPFSSVSAARGLPGAEAPLAETPPYGIQNAFCPCPQYSNGDLDAPVARQYYLPLSTPSAAGAAGAAGAAAHTEESAHLWYMPPTGQDESSLPSASVPLLLVIHGGPQGAILNTWSLRWNLGVYAAKGFGVVACNFHGSTGFGQSFCDSIRNDWGGQPFRDCMAAVDMVLSKHPYLDHARLAAAGASYGGFMINWINGHTDRFSCLVNHDGIFSLKSLYYSTEELWFPEWEFGLPFGAHQGEREGEGEGEGEGDEERGVTQSSYEQFSPDKFVHRWKTPCLVIQGGKDFRVVDSEALATFTALQRRGVASRLLYFPDENHWCLKPANSILWHDTVIEWLERWLKKDK